MADMSRRRKRDTKPISAAETEIKPADLERKLTIRLDKDLREEFRRICFNRQISMTEVLTEAIHDYVAENRQYLR
ncbi:hypothetical protein NQ042_05040 [Corynebacterium phoceense]|uniref:hypothetical protein n=1 Tax=Corynebacterium phoceense TaxID=1686286 RepID=UPI00211C27A1|nr:hypothetical protein [Corynebacterium phoceense]MCQ9333461.1 hypothetical protein [Corynebacterium phoceense]